jgi:hypothetical protein
MALQYGSGGNVQVRMGGPYGSMGGSSNKITTINAPAANWKGGTSPYSQVVVVDGITVSSKLDVQLNYEQATHFENTRIAFQAVNDTGVVTLYAYGSVPDVDLEIQVTITEFLSSGIILGDIFTVVHPQADYTQNDPSKANYIKNKPDSAISKAQETANAALPKSGGTMTGELNVLDPKQNTNAATKGYVDSRKKTAVCSLPQTGWQNNSQSVSVAGVTANNTVIVAPAPASFSHYRNFGVRCTGQGEGILTFSYEFTPTADLSVNVLILE